MHLESIKPKNRCVMDSHAQGAYEPHGQKFNFRHPPSAPDCLTWHSWFLFHHPRSRLCLNPHAICQGFGPAQIRANRNPRNHKGLSRQGPRPVWHLKPTCGIDTLFSNHLIGMERLQRLSSNHSAWAKLWFSQCFWSTHDNGYFMAYPVLW